MFKYFIDIFCKDTVIGLSEFEYIRNNRLFKNKYSSLFKNKKEYLFQNLYGPTGRYVYHL